MASSISLDLDRLLRPRSIAVVGASAREDSFGRQLQRSIASLGYPGDVFLLNARRAVIDGQAAYASLSELPGPVDCVAMAIADAAVPQALEAAAQAGARSAVLFGRAYGRDADGRDLTAVIGGIARDTGMQICGANCMGFVNIEARLQMTGFPFATLDEPGHVALVSHSGSTWSGIVGNLRQLRFNVAISAGQELATGVAEYMDYAVGLASTRVICLVLETVRRPEAFLAAVHRAHARGIAVIALKLGRSEQGQRFAQSHSGAMSGSADVYDAIFARHGVISVRSLDELMDTAELFAMPRRPHNGAIGLGCDSGGERQLIADLAEPLDLPFATLSPATVQHLASVLDPGVEVSNPLDYWGDGKDVIADAMLALAMDPNVGTLVMATNIPDGQDFTNTCTRALERIVAGTDKPVVLMGHASGTMSPTECARYRGWHVPVLMGTESALRALNHFARHAQRSGARPPQADARDQAPLPESWAVPVHTWKARLLQAAHEGETVQDLSLLTDFGLPAAKSFSTADLGLALDAAERLGFPLVAKIDSPAIAHKSDLGGVILGLIDRDAVRAAFLQLQDIAPGPVLLQQQLTGIELILGMKQDATFGPVFTVGCGGIYVEILRDFVTLLPGESDAGVESALRQLKTFPLLAGARGRPASDIKRLVAVIQGFMAMGQVLSDQIQELEINPLLVQGEHLAAVDLLVVPRHKDPS